MTAASVVRSIVPVALLAACSPSAPLGEGRYDYAASHATAEGDTVHLSGVLEITGTTSAGIEGEWNVPEFNPELEAFDSAGDLQLIARPTYFGTIVHHVRSAGGGISCEGSYSYVVGGGVAREFPLRCSLSRGAPATLPGVESPGRSRPIRPADTSAIPPR